MYMTLLTKQHVTSSTFVPGHKEIRMRVARSIVETASKYKIIKYVFILFVQGFNYDLIKPTTPFYCTITSGESDVLTSCKPIMEVIVRGFVKY